MDKKRYLFFSDQCAHAARRRCCAGACSRTLRSCRRALPKGSQPAGSPRTPTSTNTACNSLLQKRHLQEETSAGATGNELLSSSCAVPAPGQEGEVGWEPAKGRKCCCLVGSLLPPLDSGEKICPLQGNCGRILLFLSQ